MENEGHAPLTRAQRQVLEALRELSARGAPPPSLPELCAYLGLASRGSLHKQVQALVDAGLVWPMQGRQRGLRLRISPSPQRPPSAEGIELPLLGRIAAGRPIEALADAEPLSLPTWLVPPGQSCYALSVRGDSMRGLGILDGDIVILRPAEQARSGEIVVALIDDGEATLKRIEYRPPEIVLHAENPDYPPQVYAAERVRVQGILVAQLRRYR